MATISNMIPQTIVGGITKMMVERDVYVVTRLSDAYGFDKEEALRMVGVPNVEISDTESVSTTSTTSTTKRRGGRPRLSEEEKAARKAAKAAKRDAEKAAKAAEREAVKAEKARKKAELKAEREAAKEAAKVEKARQKAELKAMRDAERESAKAAKAAAKEEAKAAKEAAKAEREASKEAEKAAKAAAKAEREAIKEAKAAAKAAKAAAKKLEMPAFHLPFVGHVFLDRCFAIRANGNLFNQCMKARPHGCDYCKTCGNHGAKYGDIRSRMEIPHLDYKGTNGKKVIRYSKFMAKKDITREQVEAEATKFGIVIPEEQFEVVTTKRGRPKSGGSSKTSSGASTPKRTTKKGATPEGDLMEALAAHVKEEMVESPAATAEDSEMEEEEFVDVMAETVVDGVEYTVNTKTCDVFNKETGEYAGKYDSVTGSIDFMGDIEEEDDYEFEMED